MLYYIAACLVVNICIWPPIGIFTVHLPGIKRDRHPAHQNTEPTKKYERARIFSVN